VEKIAVIGTGVAGLGCAWNLRGKADITLFEQEARPGGHSNTVPVDEDGREVPIDTGFIVCNRVTYPNLMRLFDELGVELQPSEMSFSVQHLPSGLEYNGMGFFKLFAQKRNLARPRFLRLLYQISRFFKIARRSIEVGDEERLSVHDFARKHGFDRDLLDFYLVPMSSAVWSTTPEEVLHFPATMLIRFFFNHGFLGVRTHHPWFTVRGGARTYVRKILEKVGHARLGDAVASVDDTGRGITVRTASGRLDHFDRAIVATHADQALRLLARPDALQRRLLGPWRYQHNHATLHTDPSWMPRRKIAWASWNYRIARGPGDTLDATTHYWMNALQRVSERQNYFVSINCGGRIPRGHVLYEKDYEHPTYTLASLATHDELPRLNDRSPDQRVYFAGSYFRYGFHEDAYASAVAASAAISRHIEGSPIPA